MELKEAIKLRHSYRGPYKNINVSKDILQEIAMSAIMAPTGKNAQTTLFVIIDDQDIINKISKLPGANQAVKEAKAYIACVIDKEPAGVYHGLHFQIEDCAAAVENMLLTITSLGLASVWIDGYLRINDNVTSVNQILELPKEKTVRILLPLGYPEEQHFPRKKLPLEKRVFYNKFPK